MAKKRKVGGTYKVGFYNLKKYSGKNEEAYLERMYKRNKELFDQAYEAARKMAEKAKDKQAVVRFDETYPNIKVWMKAKVYSARITSKEENMTFNKGVREATRLTFMYLNLIHRIYFQSKRILKCRTNDLLLLLRNAQKRTQKENLYYL